MLKKILNKFYNLGTYSFCFCIFYKFYFYILALFFKVDNWHIQTPFHCRSYKQKIVNISNNLKLSSVVEVGCGVGDIISRIKADTKYGFDIEPRVIKLAKFLDKKTNYEEGSFSNFNKLTHAVDMLIAINWLHGFDKNFIENQFLKRDMISRIKYIFVDKVSKVGAECHDFEQYFKGLAVKIIDCPDPEDETRVLLLFEVKIGEKEYV